jgi:hypothetical protein
MIHLRCPKCKRMMSLDDSKAGKVGRCLKCNQKFRVPSDIIEEVESDRPEEPANRPSRASTSRSAGSQSRPRRQREPLPPNNDADIMALDGYDLEVIESAPLRGGKQEALTDDFKDAEWVEIDSSAKPLRSKPGRKRKNLFVLAIVAGCFIGALAFGVVALIFWPRRDTAEPSKDPPVPKVSVLRLQVDGKPVLVPLEAMNYNHVKRGREEFPDYFELQGRGVNIFGKFAIGFDRQWDDLIGKPLTITPQDPAKHEGDSHIGLPGKEDLKVLKGRIAVKEVLKNPQQSDPFFRGEIELELQGKGPRDTLDVKGTFEAQVHSWF